LNAGATLATASEGGLDSAVSVTGTVTMSPAANFTFNGSSHQVTGMSMQDTVNNLVINNAAGVTLSQSATINGVLRLMAGVFDNTIPFTLGPGGSISYEGGSLLTPVSVVRSEVSLIPQSFFVDQNFPNPFNPSTRIRYGIPRESFVTARIFNLLGQEVATLFEGQQNAGVYSVVFDASRIGSGMYLCRIQAGTMVDTKRMIFIR
jgi:hypothetical protein